MVGSQVRRAGVLLLVVVVIGALGCGRRRGSTPSPETSGPALQAEWSLMVTNRHWLDVDVTAILDGQREHLGTVPASRSETYVLPSRMVRLGRSVRLEAEAIGSRERTVSETFTVREGQHVVWTLESRLRSSSVVVQ